MHQLLQKEEHHLDYSQPIPLKLKAQLVVVVQVGRENCMTCWSMQNPKPTTMYQGVGMFVNDVIIKDVQIILRMEGYVSDMVQSGRLAAKRVVSTMPSKEECV